MKPAECRALILQDVHVKFWLRKVHGRPAMNGMPAAPGFPGRWQIARYTLMDVTEAGAAVSRQIIRYKPVDWRTHMFHSDEIEEHTETLVVPCSRIVGPADPPSWEEPAMIDPPTPADPDGGDGAGVPARPPDGPQDRPPMTAAASVPTDEPTTF